MAEPIVFRDGKSGRAVVSGSDAPVDEIIAAIASGQTMDEVMAAHPGLDWNGIAAALRFAANAAKREGEYPTVSVPRRGVAEPSAAYGARPGDRPVLTIDEDEYDELRYRAELFEGLLEAEAELDAGLGRPHEDVFAELLQQYGGR
jgi:uncharacterized protein (DUF433 family)